MKNFNGPARYFTKEEHTLLAVNFPFYCSSTKARKVPCAGSFHSACQLILHIWRSNSENLALSRFYVALCVKAIGMPAQNLSQIFPKLGKDV